MATIICSGDSLQATGGEAAHSGEARSEQLRRGLEAALQQEGPGVEALISALERQLGIPHSHSRRVQAFSLALASRCRCDSRSVAEISQGALLHDIGKFLIPQRILRITGRLTEAEMRVMQQHTTRGYAFLCAIPHLRNAALLALLHHERMDGKGYPLGLAGREIPLNARISILADALDVMLTGRPYAAARTMAEARQELIRCAGTQFDPDLVNTFLEAPEAEWVEIHEAFPGDSVPPEMSCTPPSSLPF